MPLEPVEQSITHDFPPFLPQVSVIIPIYNGEADLPDLINCIQEQTYPPDRVEYWLVDNNSRDRTLTLLKDQVKKLALQGITLHWVQEIQIQSSYAARNAGIKAATGEILAFTDADCRPQSDWLFQLVQPFRDEAIALVAGEVLALPGNSVLENFADRQDTLSQKHTLAHSFFPYGQTANLAIRRQALEASGLFRPYLTTGGDADLCWRVQQHGAGSIFFAEGAIVRHRHRATLAELKSQWRRYGRSNRYLHELHGVSLMRDLTLKESLYRWSRWLLKELPVTATKIVVGKANLSALLDTPLDLFCRRARSLGQKQAQLSDEARQIEWLKPKQPEASTHSLE